MGRVHVIGFSALLCIVSLVTASASELPGLYSNLKMSEKSGDYVGRLLFVTQQHARGGSTFIGLYQYSEGAPSPAHKVDIVFNKQTRSLGFSYSEGKGKTRRFTGTLKEDGIHGKFDDERKSFVIPLKCPL